MALLVAVGALTGTAAAGPRQAAEGILMERINAARADAGLPSLVAHDQLAGVAASWAGVMRGEDRLYHNPDLGGEVAPGWRRIGENVGYVRDPSATVAEQAARLHRVFMDSDGHRANILGEWHYAGVGVELAGDGTMWATVNFAATGVPPLPVGVRDASTGSCAGGAGLPGGFPDILGNVHAEAITCLAWYGVTAGTGTGATYSPADVVTRGQMAAFLARVIDGADGRPLPGDGGGSRFVDVGAEHPFAAHVNRLAAAGIANGGPGGRPADRFAPQAPVSRAQMAAFLERTYGYVTGGRLPSAGTCFPDAAGHVLRDAIDRLCVAGVVQGTAGGAYVPGAPVRRDAMASFVTRLLDVLVAENAASPPA